MATYTPNFSLTMPDYAEPADVAVLNGNTSQIDSLIYQGRRMAVGGYDSTATYNTGDLVEYSNALYRCKEDGVTGTWDSTKWELTTLAEEIEGKGEGGADVTKEVSGNPVEFTDGADAPMVKCVSAITGSQDLHGYDKPWVGGAGKNKLNTILSDIKALNTTGTWTGNNYSLNGIVFSILTDNANNVIGIKTTGTASANSTLVICNNPGLIEETNYIITGCPAGGSDSNYRLSYSNNVDNAYADYGSSVQITEFSHSYQFRTVRITIFNGYSIPTNGIVFYPMIRLATETDPTFVPYSNICPITAYDEGEIEVRGKNLFDKSTQITRGQYISDGTYQANNNRIMTDYVPAVSGYRYSISVPTNNSANLALINYVLFDADKNFLGDRSANGDSAFSGDFSHSLTVNIQNVAYIRVVLRDKTSGDTDISSRTLENANLQIEVGSSATVYEPYTSTTHTTTFPSAIYRGSEDVVNGEVTKEWGIAEFDGSSDEEWGVNTLFDTFYIIIPDAQKTKVICNQFDGKSPMVYASLNVGECAFADTGALYINFHATHHDIAQWKSDLANNPLQVAYTLATPTTSSVTPTNLPIKSLLGHNHIESSTGDLDIEYITQDFQPIVDLIEANASEPYSDDYTLDTEIEVGTWVDGSTLYRKTTEITGTKNAGYEGTIYTAGSGEHIVKLDGCIYNDYYSGMAYPINMAYSTNNGTMAFSTYVTGADAEEVLFRNGWSSAISKIYLVVYYIKSSS